MKFVFFAVCLFLFTGGFAVEQAYVVNQSSDNVTVIENDNNVFTVIATVTVGNVPNGIGLSPDGTKAYVANVSQPNEGITVFETETFTIVGTVPVTMSTAVAISPDGTLGYSTNRTNDRVDIFDPETLGISGSITVGLLPHELAFSPDGTTVYVVNSGLPDTISVIDVASEMVTATIAIGAAPQNVVVNSSGTRAYVPIASNGIVDVINTATNTIIATIPAPSIPDGIGITSDGTTGYVTSQTLDLVRELNLTNNTATGVTIAVGDNPAMVAVNSDDTLGYVANFISGSVSVIELASNMVIATITVGGGANAIALSPSPLTPLLDLIFVDPIENLESETLKNDFLTQTELFNQISWSAISPTPDKIEVYIIEGGNQTLLEVLSGDATEFFDHNKRKGEETTYWITAVENDRITFASTITVTSN